MTSDESREECVKGIEISSIFHLKFNLELFLL